MQRIPTLLQKLTEISKTDGDKLSVLDLDLMLDYTRVLYADLLEWRKRTQFTQSLTAEPGLPEEDTTVDNEPDSQSLPTSSAPPIELTNQVQHYDIPVEDEPMATGPVQTPGVIDIRSQIGINDKYQFISELFGNDKDAYERVLDNINGFERYDDAVEWLDEHAHTQYSWKDEHYPVQSFYDTLSKFFASR